MNFKNIKLVIMNENKEFIRTKKIGYLACITVIIIIINIMMSCYFGNLDKEGSIYIIDGFKSFSQFSFIAYIGILAPSIAKELNNFTWNYYLLNGINTKEILTAKYLFNFKIIAFFTNIVFSLMIFSVKIFKPFEINILGYIYILLMLNLVIAFIVVTQVSVSALIKNTSKSSIFLVIFLIISSMINSIFPFLKGLIAPFDGASIHTHVVHQILGDMNSTYNNLPGVLHLNLTQNIILATVSTLVILGITISFTFYKIGKHDLNI